jgi:hypothetical protein
MVRDCAPEDIEIPGSRLRAPRNDNKAVARAAAFLLCGID